MSGALDIWGWRNEGNVPMTRYDKCFSINGTLARKSAEELTDEELMQYPGEWLAVLDKPHIYTYYKDDAPFIRACLFIVEQEKKLRGLIK